ncbi:hypothetical protein J3B02_001776 [Coemansia erecta]|uniref:HhH-GPD domain-containing protein n=1 Tax=Coemansia asiatica TaxID=1052880 RepID=A0A9W8CI49_9FUNG|nr:hypothetical protein LPJ64_005383 [Coemansia asiatica]KAJ2856128.1 hypothetical protein J3B02_001776 [Coemansia erecta]KAJ2886921.1 hypothetical protein FB639_001479 [Coemansia asiatica]
MRRSARLASKPLDISAQVYSLPLPAAKKSGKIAKSKTTTKPKIKIMKAEKIVPDQVKAEAVAQLTTVSIPRPQIDTNKPIDSQKALDQAIAYLKAVDPKLGKFIDTVAEPCTLSLSRDRKGYGSYVSLSQSIIYQQLAGKAAAAILLRFLKRYGQLKDASKAAMLEQDDASLTYDDFVFPSPDRVAALDVGEMREVGLGQRKAEYLKEIAKRFSDGELSDERLVKMTDEEVSTKLVAIRGIGQWTADMFLMFHLKRPDVLPTLDLAVRKAMCHHFGTRFTKNTPTHEEMVEMSRHWVPYRSVATWYMWRLLGTITQKS